MLGKSISPHRSNGVIKAVHKIVLWSSELAVELTFFENFI